MIVPSEGQITFSFNNEARELLKENGRYDLVLYTSEGVPQAYIAGEVFLIKGVTR